LTVSFIQIFDSLLWTAGKRSISLVGGPGGSKGIVLVAAEAL
jgi:hypothetical protein